MPLPGQFSAEIYTIVTLEAGEDVLVCTINASAAGQRDGLKGALERHIDRFAFREVPLAYNWADA
ncbi:MAG: DUF2218 domain-containing protein [Novosphingobium sp.]|nr:DUF2218 domain-containing protein [Novosphingobium sp.]